MNDYLTEQEELEKLKNWWKDNKWYVITGVLAGAGLLFGNNYYKKMVRQKSEASSAAYVSVAQSAKGDSVDELLNKKAQLSENYDDTHYAVMADLTVAKVYMDKGEKAKAAETLQAAADKADGELKHIARLRLARVQASMDQYDQALATLGAKDQGEFVSLYQEVSGDVLAASGKTEAAIEEYKKALNQAVPLVDNQYLLIKLQALGGNIDE